MKTIFLIFTIISIYFGIINSHEVPESMLCSFYPAQNSTMPTDQISDGSMTGYYYDCVQKACSPFTIPKGMTGSHNFWTIKALCDVSCPAGTVTCMDPTQNINPQIECQKPFTDGKNPNAKGCTGSQPIWTYNITTQNCSQVMIPCNVYASLNAFPTQEECSQFCDDVMLPGAVSLHPDDDQDQKVKAKGYMDLNDV